MSLKSPIEHPSPLPSNPNNTLNHLPPPLKIQNFLLNFNFFNDNNTLPLPDPPRELELRLLPLSFLRLEFQFLLEPRNKPTVRVFAPRSFPWSYP